MPCPEFQGSGVSWQTSNDGSVLAWLLRRRLSAFSCSSASRFLLKTGLTPAGTPGGTRHSELKQINHTNVAKLTVAWTFDTEDWSDDKHLPSRSHAK